MHIPPGVSILSLKSDNSTPWDWEARSSLLCDTTATLMQSISTDFQSQDKVVLFEYRDMLSYMMGRSGRCG